MSHGHLHRLGVAESYDICSFSFLRSLYTCERYHSCGSIHCHSSDMLVVVLTQTHRRWNCKVGLICFFFFFLMARDVKNLKLLVTCIIINTYTQRERQTRAHRSEI